jgi:hypothetical protein
MLLISHRGNVDGMNPDRENSIPYINGALNLGFSVMVDVWFVGGTLALGNHRPQYGINAEFLRNPQIICKARSAATLNALMDMDLHCFANDRDDYSVTTEGYVWIYPGCASPPRGILYMPEFNYKDVRDVADIGCAGVCSNWIIRISEGRKDIHEGSPPSGDDVEEYGDDISDPEM